MTDKLPICDVLVVGAGAAGLTTARILQDRGLRILVLDKGRGVGGRMATRRIEGYRFDHGAQSVYFEDAKLARTARDWWHAGGTVSCDYPFPAAGRPGETGPLCARGGISALARAMAAGLDIRTGIRVASIEASGAMWTVRTADGTTATARALILTPPVPQALELVRQGGIRLTEEADLRLAAVTYERCLALLCTCPASGPLLARPFVQPGGDTLSLLIDQFAKGVSPLPGAVTLHAAGDFSARHWDAPEEEVTSALLDAAREHLAARPIAAQLHRWRYSRAVQGHPESFEMVEHPGLLVFAGDGFAGRDIEGAMQSGRAAALAVADALA